MVAGETGRLTLNALSHVAVVLRHVNGNATIQVRHTVGYRAQETKMKLSRVTLTYVQVVTCSNLFYMTLTFTLHVPSVALLFPLLPFVGYDGLA